MEFRAPVAAALLIALAGQADRVRAEEAPPPHPAFASARGPTELDPVPPPPTAPVRPGDDPRPALSPESAPRLNAVRVTSPPVLDGKLDDPAWKLAPGNSDFTQQTPYDGARPSEPTTVRVVYDDEALYVGFDCTQVSTPISGRLTRRDEDSESDWVWLYVDSRRDYRTAFFFAVNVKGVVGDGIMHDGMAVSFEWDENWEGRSALTPTGWSAELRIPLRVLRFTPDLPVQSWGFSASRFIALRQEKDDWPYISRSVAAPIPFFGRLSDLRDLRRGGAIELRPYALGQVRYRALDQNMVANGFDAGGSAGADLKLHVTQSLTLDAAVNPDFSQVEADQLILNLANYEIQFPEKRPLFLEGADLFSTPLGVFYSRRIGIPPATPNLNLAEERLVDVPGAATIYAATKFAGRLRDAWTVGFLSALASRNEYQVVPRTMPAATPMLRTVEPLTAFNVARVRREIGDRAQIGVIATATNRFEATGGRRICPTGETGDPGVRCFRDSLVGGLDAIWRSPAAEYVAAGQLVGGAVNNGLPEVQLDGTSIGSGDRGIGGWLRLAKEGGRHVLVETTYTGIGRRLTYNDLGFMPRQNLHEVRAGFELRSLDPGDLTLERHARLDLAARRTLDGLDIGSTAELAFTLKLQGFWSIHAAALAAPAHYDDREVGDGAALQRAFSGGGKVEVISDPRRRWWGQVKGELRFLAGGLALDATATLAWRPLAQFAIELDPQVSYSSGEQRYASHADANINPPTDGPYIFGRLLARSVGGILRVQYTFTPHLSLQTFAQLFLAAGHYTDFRQSPRSSPPTPRPRLAIADLQPFVGTPPSDADFEQAALNINVVLRWEYRLGSTLFVVYSRSQVPEVALMGAPASLSASAISSVPATDTVLVKLSFWWAS